ncbi:MULTISPECIES: alpha/beta hydrolase [unclassified Granulicatella]|uniref:alpha/beta hydrolase n=1 Tax=unclassified Granulicatella TaxID=2630493 RepID=UPI00143196F9|nr:MULTISPECIES: alpha/beta hydrolase [unclassified Granulicatella]MBF0780565.1 DUF2974 domain-containing protein [Granulicatella sp. 19428wC4_WM01]
MSNLETFDNLYANLAQSAYVDRPYNFPDILPNIDNKLLDYSVDGSGKDGDTTFGGQHLKNNGVVYLQSDSTQQAGQNSTSKHRKSVLVDEKEGFQSYFLTDTPTLNLETKDAYLSIRGSDGFSSDTINDWVWNNAMFTLFDDYIPQAKLANTAIDVKLGELGRNAPKAKLHITGHSLGSIVSVQSLAKLTDENLDKIGEVVVFQGPDTMASLKKMKLSKDKIAKISQKVTYYVNPFDLVSMFNRHTPLDEQVGRVNVIIPKHFTSTFDNLSSHDFGEFQIDSYGNVLVASEDFHPEYLRAGEKVAELLNKFKKANVGGKIRRAFSFMKEYQSIIEETRQQSIQWNIDNIPKLQQSIGETHGAKQLILRSQLLFSTGQLAMLETENFVNDFKRHIKNYKEQIYQIIQDMNRQAHAVAHFLSHAQVHAILECVQVPNFWNEDIEAMTVKELDDYKLRIDQFSEALFKSIEHLEALDKEQGANFEQVMGSVQERWAK